MRSDRVRFSNDDGVELAGILDHPGDDSQVAYAIFAHCFTCSKDYKAPSHIARALAASGIAVLRFDFAGLGDSEGDFADTTFSSNVADLLAAARFLTDDYGAPGMLIGHSLGGAAVLRAARQLDSVTAVVTIAAPASPAFVLRHLAEIRGQLEQHGEAEVEIAGRRFRLRQQFVDDLVADRRAGAPDDLGRALLVLHSPADTIVGIDHAEAIFAAARQPKSFVSLDGADHLLTAAEDSRWAAAVIAAWARRYLGGTPALRPGRA